MCEPKHQKQQERHQQVIDVMVTTREYVGYHTAQRSCYEEPTNTGDGHCGQHDTYELIKRYRAKQKTFLHYHLVEYGL
jgi:hypothetical protein